MAKTKKKTKAEELQEAVAEAVGAGRELHLESVDFSDPNRPKTCLEVDFPILPINHVAAIEGNAGKPIYQMSKWWARRRSSVFRAMLIAAATKAPEDQGEAAKTVWDAYYANHQKNEAFRKLKVADIFMGGGTTVVEGSRLGMQMYGNDLNPVAWLVVKNELAQVDPKEVQKLLDSIEAEVKPQIMPFYACDCPRGHKGKWTYKPTGKVMPDEFDPLSLTPEQRPEYEYSGPEVIYTFWAKHGPCQSSECNHRTPIMSSPVIAVKTLTVKAWTDRECQSCGESFDVEQQQARMAPAAMLVVADTETPFAVMDIKGHFTCPHCGHQRQEEMAALKGKSDTLGGAAKNKKIELTLLIHPDWLKGSPGKDSDGKWFGGSVTDSAEATSAWNEERATKLKLIEVRGTLPETITCPDTQELFSTGKKGGTVPGKSKFKCQESTCGREQDVLTSIRASKKSGPIAEYAIQGYCPICNENGIPYGGRFFVTANSRQFDHANKEWESLRSNALSGYWPQSEIPYGFMTHHNNGGIPNHGFTHWWTLFNSRQLLVHSQLLRSIVSSGDVPWTTREFILGGFQQFLRNQSMLTIWHMSHDHFAPGLSNNNFHPKATMVEVGVFTPVGYGPWPSTLGSMHSAPEWSINPWELLPKAILEAEESTLADSISGRSIKVFPGDPVIGNQTVEVQSSTDLITHSNSTLDLIVTDPPFGGLLHYSELADFFYVWLRLVLKDKYPDIFNPEYSPKVLEAVANRARHPDDPDAFYQKILTECWREAFRVLKPAGLLTFTFHHSEDEPWVAVLESLFQAGFYLEAAYPIRSDETKGEGAKPGTFGSQQIEFDIVHVCRKRLEEPEPISWARLRRQIMKDVRQLQEIIEQHQKEGLGEADLQVIRRGKAHGTKLAAEKRFKQPNGPRVMICTAAGREGINLQHARVLFNFDLPWNPMDLEQRIGRIHRYGQKHTAQVYNLVLSDTIEGKIFLLLDDKLKEIAKALGKVDEHGEVAEDLRSQILGQLSERLSYESLYAQAISDPELKRTRLELEQALSNASEARNVVYELFQDLDGFSLDDYQPFSDTSEGMNEIVRFVRTAVEDEGKTFRPEANGVFVVSTPDNGDSIRFTIDRDASLELKNIDLLGLDHPSVVQYMQRFRDLADDQIGIRVRSDDGRTGVLSIWHVTTQGERGETRTQMLTLAVDAEGQRIPSWEKQTDRMFQLEPASTDGDPQINLLTETLEPMIQRELVHRGFLAENRGYDARLVGWVEVV